MYRVVFTRHKINAETKDGVDFENTPTDFQDFLNNLFFQIREEYTSFDRSVASDEKRYELNKKQFKNILLMDIFCLLVTLMERRNTFLEEGHFIDKEKLSEFLKTNPDATTKLKYWLNNYYYSKWDKNPLPDKEIIEILDFLYKYIDKLIFSKKGNYLNWSSRSLFFNEEKLNELLDLNENLLIALNKYYLQKENIKKLKKFSEYYKFHIEVPRMFEKKTSKRLNSYHNKARRLRFYKVLNLLKIKKQMGEEVEDSEEDQDNFDELFKSTLVL
jgi:hypothetical protein